MTRNPVTNFMVLSFALALAAGSSSCQKERSSTATTDTTNATHANQKPESRQAQSVTLSEDTLLQVRTTTTVSTKSHGTGDHFVATLEESLVAGDWVIAAKGATVEGQIAEAYKGGRISGRARLAVRLTRLHTTDGQKIDLRTNTVARYAKGTKMKDAQKIGIGSGIGAAIGAVAGGGKGAAIGAAAGAGAGTGVVLATHGAPAILASETLLKFRLRAPVKITRQAAEP